MKLIFEIFRLVIVKDIESPGTLIIDQRANSKHQIASENMGVNENTSSNNSTYGRLYKVGYL